MGGAPAGTWWVEWHLAGGWRSGVSQRRCPGFGVCSLLFNCGHSQRAWKPQRDRPDGSRLLELRHCCVLTLHLNIHPCPAFLPRFPAPWLFALSFLTGLLGAPAYTSTSHPPNTPGCPCHSPEVMAEVLRLLSSPQPNQALWPCCS